MYKTVNPIEADIPSILLLTICNIISYSFPAIIMKRQFPWMQTCTVIFVIEDWSITHMQTQFPHLTHSETHMNLASYIINQHRRPYKNKGYELWWLIYLPKSGTRETASTWFTRLDYKSTYTFLYPTTKNKTMWSESLSMYQRMVVSALVIW